MGDYSELLMIFRASSGRLALFSKGQWCKEHSAHITATVLVAEKR